MASRQITIKGVLTRFLIAILLVFATYNPSGFSYVHWFSEVSDDQSVFAVFVGVALIIGWVIFIRATMRSLGFIGLILAAGFFGSLCWLLVDWGFLSLTTDDAVSYVVLFVLSSVLAVGISWSHIRRRMSGQTDVDDVDNH